MHAASTAGSTRFIGIPRSFFLHSASFTLMESKLKTSFFG